MRKRLKFKSAHWFSSASYPNAMWQIWISRRANKIIWQVRRALENLFCVKIHYIFILKESITYSAPFVLKYEGLLWWTWAALSWDFADSWNNAVNKRIIIIIHLCVCVYDDVCMQAAHGSCHGDIRVIGQMLSDARVTGFSRTWYYKSPKLRLCDPFCFSTGFSDSPSFSVFAAAQYAHLVGCKWCAVYLCPCCFWRGDFDCPDMLAVWIMSSLPSGQSV